MSRESPAIFSRCCLLHKPSWVPAYTGEPLLQRAASEAFPRETIYNSILQPVMARGLPCAPPWESHPAQSFIGRRLCSLRSGEVEPPNISHRCTERLTRIPALVVNISCLQPYRPCLATLILQNESISCLSSVHHQHYISTYIAAYWAAQGRSRNPILNTSVCFYVFLLVALRFQLFFPIKMP